MKLSHTRIATIDVARLADFYQKLTGITPVGMEGQYLEFRTTGATLAICSQEAVDTFNAAATTPASNRSAILEFLVDDVDVERERLHSIVDEFVLEPVTQPWGNRSMLFRDPDGNLINFFKPMQA